MKLTTRDYLFFLGTIAFFALELCVFIFGNIQASH